MKKILLYIFICLTLNAYAINLPKLPNEGTLCTAYTMQTTSIKDEKEILPKTQTKAIVYTSLSDDNKLLIEFSELQMRWVKNEDEFGIIKLKQTYYFDGDKWNLFEYTSEYEDGIKTNDYILRKTKDTPILINTLEEFYNAKCFLIDGFYYYNNNTVADAISGKMKYPEVEINKKYNAISLKSKTTTNDISAILKIENNTPILSEYSDVYTTSNSIKSKIDVKFSGNIKIENTDIVIPQELERIYTSFPTKDGFKFKTSIISCKYLKDFDFNKKAPKITDKWKVYNIFNVR